MKRLFSFLIAFSVVFPALAKDNATDGAVIATVYATIADNHITPVKIEEIAVAGLRGLNRIDRNLTFADGSESVFLYYRGKQNGLWRKPQDPNDAAAWGTISAKVIDTAVKKSPAARERDFEIVETILDQAAAALNDNSRYHSELTPEKNDGQNPGYFFVSRKMGDILYLKIGSFNQHTFENASQALSDNPGVKAVIIDLRGNQGGLINEAIEVARLFIDGGIIVSVKGRKDSKIKYYTAENREDAANLKIAVLIDGKTASSAEMLAAALQEQTQAVLVGTLSFGKGSIQELYRFENGGKLALTSAYFATPSGKNIDRKGLLPDYCTYKLAPRVKNIALENYRKSACPAESRSDMDSDIDIAAAVLQQ